MSTELGTVRPPRTYAKRGATKRKTVAYVLPVEYIDYIDTIAEAANISASLAAERVIARAMRRDIPSEKAS